MFIAIGDQVSIRRRAGLHRFRVRVGLGLTKAAIGQRRGLDIRSFSSIAEDTRPGQHALAATG
jgi:hypothetical protein